MCVYIYKLDGTLTSAVITLKSMDG